MKRTGHPEPTSTEAQDLLPEYHFDYGKASPNRFASASGPGSRVVVLEPDVAEVFTTPEAVNAVLRALITTMPSAHKDKSAA